MEPQEEHSRYLRPHAPTHETTLPMASRRRELAFQRAAETLEPRGIPRGETTCKRSPTTTQTDSPTPPTPDEITNGQDAPGV